MSAEAETELKDKRKQELLLKTYERSLSLPDCFEKSLTKCLHLINLKRCKTKDDLNNNDAFQEDIKKEIEFMNKCIESEDLKSFGYSKALQEALSYLDSMNLELAYKKIECIFNEYRELDIGQIREMYEAMNKNITLFDDTDIILLLGPTGSGKSSLLHYLCGSTMVRSNVDRKIHIQPTGNSKLPYLIDLITTSANCISETNSLIPIILSLKDIGIEERGNFIICDTPGFGDTNGPEVDIANTIMILNAVKKCKSIRPVVLINSADFSAARMNFMIELANLLSNMVKNIKENMKSFSFLFTKFSNSDSRSEVLQKIVDLNKRIINDSRSDPTLEEFFKEFIVLLKKDKPQFVDLLDRKPTVLFNFIKNKTPIEFPEDFFTFSFMDKTKKSIEKQVHKHQHAINASVKSHDFKLVKHKLNELKYLNDLLEQPYISSILTTCIEHVIKSIDSEHDKSLTAFNKCLELGNTLDESDILKYKKAYEIAMLTDDMRESLLDHKIIPSAKFIQNLMKKVENIEAEMKNLELNDSLKLYLDKLSLLSKHFETVKFDKKIIEHKVDLQGEKFQQYLLKDEFENCLKVLKFLKKKFQLFEDYLNEDFKAAQTKHFHIELIEHVKKILSDADIFLNKSILNEDDIDKLCDFAKMLESAKIVFSKEQDLNEISNVYDTFVTNVKNIFENIDAKINDKLSKGRENSFSELEVFVSQLNLIMLIPQVKNSLTKPYYETLDTIKTLVNNIKNEFQTTIISISDENDNSKNYEKLIHYVKCLENIKWIEPTIQGIYSNFLETSKQNISNKSMELKKQILSIKIEVHEVENLKTSFDKLKQLKDIRDLLKELVNLDGDVNEAETYLDNKMKLVLLQIDEISLNKAYEGNNLKTFNFNKLEIALKFLTACKGVILSISQSIECEKYRLKLESKIDEYTKETEGDINGAYLFIASYDFNKNENEEELIRRKSILYDRMQELCLIEKICPLINEQLHNSLGKDNLLQILKSKLKNYLEKLKNEMEKFMNDGDNGKLSNMLDHLRYLKCFDEFFENEPFEYLRSQILAFLVNNKLNILTEIKEDIERGDYVSVSERLSEMQNSNNLNHLLKQAKKNLNFHINSLKDKTEVMTIRFINRPDNNATQYSENLIQIVKNLKSLNNIQILESFSQQNEEIIKFIERIQEKLSQNFMEHIKIIENNMKEFNFLTARNDLKSIVVLSDIMDDYCTSEILEKIKLLHDSEKTNLIKLVNDYENMELDKLFLNPPRTLFVKLENCGLLRLRDELHEIIKQKFITRLELIRTIKSKFEREKELLKLSALFFYLSDNLKDDVKSNIDHMKTIIQNSYECEKNEIDDAIKCKNINKLEILFKKNESSDDFISTINKFLRDELISYSDELQKKSLSVVYDAINYVFQCRSLYQKTAKTNEILEFKNLVKQVNKKFDTATKNIVQFLQKNFQLKANEVMIDDIDNNFDDLKSFCSDSGSESTSILKSLNALTETLNFRKHAKNDLDILFQNLDYNLENVIRKIYEAFIKNQEEFQKSLESIDSSHKLVLSVSQALWCMRKWNCVFLNLYQNDFDVLSQPDNVFEMHIENFKKVKSYSDLIKEAEERFETIKESFIQQDFINDITKKRQKERDSYFENLKNKIQIYNGIAKHLKQYTNMAELFENEIYGIIKSKNDKIIDDLNSILAKDVIDQNDAYNFYICYDVLYLCNNKINLSEKYNECLKKIIDDFKSKIFKKVNEYAKKITNLSIDDAAKEFIKIKKISESILTFKSEIDSIIEETLKAFRQKHNQQGLIQLGFALNKDPDGKTIVNENKIYESFIVAAFNEKTIKNDLNYVLKNLKGEFIEIEKLKSRYGVYINKYNKIVSDFFDRNVQLSKLYDETKQLSQKIILKENNKWDPQSQRAICELVAYLFALWTLDKAEYFLEAKGLENQASYLRKPQITQVISVFRLLSIGDSDDEIKSNLCEIKTGEGKSIVLAVTACVFALLGFRVSCACYSEYLTKRDYEAFKSMFNSLNLAKQIEYDTIGILCDKLINKGGNLREIVTEFIRKGVKNNINANIFETSPKHILLVDEVDTILNKYFCHSFYCPAMHLKDPVVSRLTDFIWKNSKQNTNLDMVKKSQEYQDCCNKFRHWQSVIDIAITKMLLSLRNFENQEYVVYKDRIGYVINDAVATLFFIDYHTMFAYYLENEKGEISDITLNENKYIGFGSFKFSYPQMPKAFKFIIGVTGTLHTLTDHQKNFFKTLYGIEKFTFTPSLFSDNLKFDKSFDNDIIIRNTESYHSSLVNEIYTRMQATNSNSQNRPILVFFETSKQLHDFYKCDKFKKYKNDTQILTEEQNLTVLEKELFIKHATRSGSISLLTRSFGRGTDFLCSDKLVAEIGGVHVIQTFFSEDLNEEIQIRGRTGRQGDPGSYSMVLLEEEILKEKSEISLINKENIENNKKDIYNFLNSIREKLANKRSKTMLTKIEADKKEHDLSIAFLKNVSLGNVELVRDYIIKHINN